MPIDSAAVLRALDNDELEPCFQPVIDLPTGRLSGFEILARWKHPDLGLVLPENFISLAEEDGLIGRLMQQILRKAFLSAPLLPAPLVLAVNVSPTQLHEPDLPGQLRLSGRATHFRRRAALYLQHSESARLGSLA